MAVYSLKMARHDTDTLTRFVTSVGAHECHVPYEVAGSSLKSNRKCRKPLASDWQGCLITSRPRLMTGA